jgi:hypothetical protein
MGERLKRSISSSKATMVEIGSMHGQLGTRLLFEELVMGVGRHKAKRKRSKGERGKGELSHGTEQLIVLRVPC